MNGREGLEEKSRLGRGRAHTVELVNRESAAFAGVTDVEAFNEEEVVLLTEMGVIVLAGKNAPAIAGEGVLSKKAVADGNVITGRGMGCAIAFGLTIVEKLVSREAADALAGSIVYER